MTIGEHLKEFGGLPVLDFPAPGADVRLPEPDSVAWRIAVEVYDSEETWQQAFGRFAEAVDTTRVTTLVVGGWDEAYDGDSAEVVATLVGARDRLPALRSLFLGDMTYEEAEISWIQQCDVTPLLAAFPALEELGVRGAQGLEFPAVTHERLRILRVETGGLPAGVVRGIAASDLPALRRLELWLGTSWYGADTQVADLEPFLTGGRLPALRHLGLRNSDIADDIATALAGAPVVARLRTLDLSMGTLGDEGALALLAGQPLTHLEKLDLHHHFISPEVEQRVQAALEPSGVTIDLQQRNLARDGLAGRYTAVAE
ncbi:STM4015 family protein [Streptomyces sp. NPDC090022]|uniref:STM4015 family protein n=1 Tax=Streptomyces sp. NPDC090022 TaxID=3365920 RepID=UPI003810CBAA